MPVEIPREGCTASYIILVFNAENFFLLLFRAEYCCRAGISMIKLIQVQVVKVPLAILANYKANNVRMAAV